MELTTNQKGDLTELYVLTAFMERGIMVSTPYGQNSRYDFIIDVNNNLYRVQVKASKIDDDHSKFTFYTASSHITGRGHHKKTYSSKEVDLFATYCEGHVYIIPILECEGKKQKTLRFVPPKNNQKEGIYYAKDYELDLWLDSIKE